MTIPETVLTFVGAPVAIIAAVTLAVLGPGELRAPARYRPGRPWPHEPAWFVPHPDPAGGPAAASSAAISGHHAPVIAGHGGAGAAIGGASGEW